ncbi:hypothetical protein [Gallaecimonas xiamenensis]|uniref:Uncharacterized protein n=1 Tax=Gallaecimonas xiamenensis 3-C-1 TaxID=745411 RepID=K2JYD1_9GAMM|nr:hypothetical protein [Gallaecimonas xiamenensis]EKE70220.1 hypothetical protein B3C1_13998 [Gallaecimonas xiamenensis 3-C-1]
MNFDSFINSLLGLVPMKLEYIAPLCLFILIIHFKPLDLFFRLRELRRAEASFLKEVIASNSITLEDRSIVEEQFERKVFFISTGVDACKIVRDFYKDLISSARGQFGWRQIKRADQYLVVRNGRPSYQVKWYHHLKYGFSLVYIFGCSAYALFLVGLGVLSIFFGGESAKLIIYGCFSALCAVIVYAVELAYKDTKKIISHISECSSIPSIDVPEPNKKEAA